MKYFILKKGSTYEKIWLPDWVVYVMYQVDTEMLISLAVFLGGIFYVATIM